MGTNLKLQFQLGNNGQKCKVLHLYILEILPHKNTLLDMQCNLLVLLESNRFQQGIFLQHHFLLGITLPYCKM
jgi:hypothetical protein